MSRRRAFLFAVTTCNNFSVIDSAATLHSMRTEQLNRPHDQSVEDAGKNSKTIHASGARHSSGIAVSPLPNTIFDVLNLFIERTLRFFLVISLTFKTTNV